MSNAAFGKKKNLNLRLESIDLATSFEKSSLKPFCFTKGELSDLADYKLNCDITKANLESTQILLRDCRKQRFQSPIASTFGFTVSLAIGIGMGVLIGKYVND